MILTALGVSVRGGIGYGIELPTIADGRYSFHYKLNGFFTVVILMIFNGGCVLLMFGFSTWDGNAG